MAKVISSDQTESLSINNNAADSNESAAAMAVGTAILGQGLPPLPTVKQAMGGVIESTPSDIREGESEDDVVEDMVDIPVLNEDGSRYEIKKVTRERASIITAQMMKEPSEGGGGDRLSTIAYNQAYHYAWVSRDRVHPTTTEAMQKGYRPHVEQQGAESLGHTMETVPGWGKCVTYGDLVLVACPRVAAEHREEQYNTKRARDRGLMQTAAVDHMENVLNERGVNDGKTRVMSEKSGTTFENRVLNADQARANAMADAYEQARNYDDGRKTYAGFQGKPGFNDAVPESPMVRRLMERQAALSGS